MLPLFTCTSDDSCCRCPPAAGVFRWDIKISATLEIDGNCFLYTLPFEWTNRIIFFCQEAVLWNSIGLAAARRILFTSCAKAVGMNAPLGANLHRGGAIDMDRLHELEAQSIFVFREAFARPKRIALLWSLGKDSNVMIWIARKAFFGRVPFPVLHVDTGKKFPEMYAFRDRYAVEWNLDLTVEPCPPLDSVDPTLPPAARSAARKTEGLKTALGKYGFDALVAGIRRDEEPTRAKERVFSPRGAEGSWDVREQPPEFWDHFNAAPPPGAHLRVHPI